MKKILILAVLMLSVGSVAYASGYEQQLTELNNLLEMCEERNISVPYEEIGIKTFERFINYLADDEKNGVSADIMEYNNDAMQRLYAETAANLNAYIDGTKTPPMVPEYDMMNTSVSGMGITDGTNKVFSAGYGYFDTVKKDIENLHDFGMENMQIETGPDRISGLPDWDYSASGAEYYFDVVSEENNRALKVVYKSESAENTYLVIRQKIWVSPSKRYYYKASYKGKNVDKNAVSIKVHGNASVETNIDPVSDTWQNTGWQSYKATDDETYIYFDIYVSDKCEELLLDDILLTTGTSSSDNLLVNGNFENLYSETHINSIRSYLERAEESNVAVSFMLQPMYFWRIPGCEDMYKSSTETSYNINDERAKEKIEQYLRIIVPIIAEYDSVRDICMSNEPTFYTPRYPDFYNPRFRNYLLENYSSLENINKKYGTSYSDINQITMPTEYSASALFYDWMCFNEDELTRWHEWMSGIIKEYTDKPLHSKMMSYILPYEYDDRRNLFYGTDAEKFAEFCDYAGNDAISNISWEDTLVTKMMWYDYLYSVTGKPVYNSEDHFISDGDTVYSADQKNNVRYNLWQGAIHGRSMTTMWVWERTYDSGSSLHSSILTRPDCVAEAGYASLDMRRSANDIIKLSSKKPDVALFYSKTSRVFNDDYLKHLVRYYKALLFNGKRVGFVTESSLDKLSEYEYLVIPSVSYTTEEALSAVNTFIDNGGKVIYYDGSTLSNKCMYRNKFGSSLDSSKIRSKGKEFTVKDVDSIEKAFQNYFSEERISIIDNSTGKKATNVEYEYYIGNEDSLLINMVYHSFDSQKNVSVYLDGKKVSGMKNILTGEVMGDSYTLEGYVPLTLKLRYTTQTPSQPGNLAYGNNVISWDDDEKAAYYNVYYKDESGSEILYKIVDDSYCVYSGYGTYRVEGVNTLETVGISSEIIVEPPVKPDEPDKPDVPENDDDQEPEPDPDFYDDFEIIFENVISNGNSVSVTVKVTNKSNRIRKAKTRINSSLGKCAVTDLWLSPMESRSFNFHFNGEIGQLSASVSEGTSIKKVICNP